MRKLFFAFIFVTSVACTVGVCCLQEKEVEFEQLPYKKNTGELGYYYQNLSIDMSQINRLDYLDEETDCPVVDTPPTSPKKK